MKKLIAEFSYVLEDSDLFNYSKLKHQIEFNAPESIQSFILVNTSGAQVVVKDAQYFKTHNYIEINTEIPAGLYYSIVISSRSFITQPLIIPTYE